MRLLCFLFAAGHLGAPGARGAATPEKCEQWAREGECVKNHKFMLVECRAACASDARAPPRSPAAPAPKDASIPLLPAAMQISAEAIPFAIAPVYSGYFTPYCSM